MSACRFGLIGTGYRAAYFARVAQALPERFQVCGLLGRNREKAEAFAQRYGIPLCADLDQLLAAKPSFVVLSVSRGQSLPLLTELMRRGLPVLCETPPAETEEELKALWQEALRLRARVDVAEQYFLQPLYHAWHEAIRMGLLGPVQAISLSALHGYHAVSIIRRFLGVGMEGCSLSGERHELQAVKTSGRDGPCFDGSIQEYRRDRVSLRFDSGKLGLFDFAGIQYHSFIRTRQLTVQGLRGEIDDLSIRYLGEDFQPMRQQLERFDFGRYDSREMALHRLMLGERLLYENPFPNARLNDDELAIAGCLQGMAAYAAGGAPFYGLREGLQDSYLALRMEEALQNPLQLVRTEPMPWQ